ncbi:DUF916 and DUF3324 domain-containing protein [Vagococcus silagei]|uniref:DUF916 and DUF3324 domain-containing protein n=1 Tax=Vagococcus silagei TaxID=2508885 RepID=A0A4S3B889_9ENTE|nr:DUF916 and DUF3324 domain-containing protein [Vagococcus silagei]THB62340.1 DUF916 and DUF3324 domain-containing protein [Vagococcus silagei]
MKKKNIVIMVLLSLLILVSGQTSVHADQSLAVSVNAVLPKNQHNKDVTYYDLRMQPNQKQELDFELNNSSDKDQKILLQINNATTNDAGSIDYSDRGGKVKRDNTLKLALSDVAQVPKEVTVKAKSKQVVKIKLTMPAEKYNGSILGGIRVTTPDEEEKKDAKDSGGMKIKNKVAYSVAINLTETDEPVKAELDLLKVFPGQTAGRNVVKANVQNSQPTVLEDIEYYAEVTKEGNKKVLHKAQAQKYRFAPNSNFNFDVSWESQPFKAGKYTLNMRAESKDTKQKWNWTKNFEITENDAKKFNKTAVDLDQDNTKLYIIIGLITLLLLIILIIIFIFLKKKKEEQRRIQLKKRKKAGKNPNRRPNRGGPGSGPRPKQKPRPKK